MLGGVLGVRDDAPETPPPAAPPNATVGALQRMGYKDPGSRGEGINIPLLMAGAGMVAARTPHFGVALGEGIKAGGESLMAERQADIARESARADLLTKALGNMKAVSDYNMLMGMRGGQGISPIGPQQPDANAPKGPDGAPVASLSGNPALAAGAKAGQKAAAMAGYIDMPPEQLLRLGELYSSNPLMAEFGKTLLEMGKSKYVERQKMLGTSGIDVIGYGSDGRPIHGVDPSIAASKAELKGAEEGFLIGPDGQPIDYMGPAKAQREGRIEAAKKGQDLEETIDNDPTSATFGQKKKVFVQRPGAGGGPRGSSGVPQAQDGLPSDLPPGVGDQIKHAQEVRNQLAASVDTQTVSEGKVKGTAELFKRLSSSRWQEHRAEISEGLSDIFGREKADQYSKMLDTDPAAVQKIQKDAILNSFTGVKDSLGGSRFAAQEIVMMNKAVANATMHPETAHMILADTLAVIRRHRDAYNALESAETGETARRNPEAFLARWSQKPENSYEKYKKQSAEELGLFAGMKDPSGKTAKGGIPTGITPEQARAELERRRGGK